MRALLAHGPGNYELQDDVQQPAPGPGEVLLKTISVGLCASDTKMFAGGDFHWGQGGRVTAPLPVIPGHEFVGRIVKFGEPKADKHLQLKVGQVVVVEQLLGCECCSYCSAGNQHKCDSLRVFGQGCNGPLADYVLVPRQGFIHPVPSNVDSSTAFLAEPLSIGIRAVMRAEIQGSDTICVLGCGTIGLSVISAVRASAPGAKIVAVDLGKKRFPVAIAAGADRAVEDASTLDFGDRHGPDVVFECTGAPSAILGAFELVSKCGKIVAVSITASNPIPLPWNTISATKELSVIGSSLGHGAWPEALQLIASGKFPVKEIITHRFNLEDWEKAFKLAGNKSCPSDNDDTIKVMIDIETHPVKEASGDSQPCLKKRRVCEDSSKETKPVEHIVMMKVKAGAPVDELEAALRSYFTKIPGIESIAFGPLFCIKGAPEEAVEFAQSMFTHVARIRFPAQEALDAFGPNPVHAAIRDEIVGNMVENKLVLDFFDQSSQEAIAKAAAASAKLAPTVFGKQRCFALNDGAQMPVLGFGTWGSNDNAQTIANAVRSALRAGYRHFDLADKYLKEAEIGTVLQEEMRALGISRGQLYITGKVSRANHVPVDVRNSATASLKALGIQYFDLFLVDWPTVSAAGFAGEACQQASVPLQQTWKAMEDLAIEGITRSIGVSNFTVPLLIDLLSYASIKPVVNQVELNPLVSQPGLVHFCRQKEIQMVAYSPLGPSLLENPIILELAKVNGVSPVVVALAWAIRCNIAVIHKSLEPAQLAESTTAIKFAEKLTAAEVQSIDALSTEVRHVK